MQERIDPIIAAYPELRFAFCAHDGIVDVRLQSGDVETATDRLTIAAEKCRIALGTDFFAYGDACLARLLVQQLRCWDRTLAIAKSCTGGLVSSAFTDIPGASKVFLGGVVCYTNQSKMDLLDVPEAILMQHGAVSAEAAVAMATGAAERFSSDYSLAVTGFAGPGGGTTENPVGTVYIANTSPSGAWWTRPLYSAERTAVKARAAPPHPRASLRGPSCRKHFGLRTGSRGDAGGRLRLDLSRAHRANNQSEPAPTDGADQAGWHLRLPERAQPPFRDTRFPPANSCDSLGYTGRRVGIVAIHDCPPDHRLVGTFPTGSESREQAVDDIARSSRRRICRRQNLPLELVAIPVVTPVNLPQTLHCVRPRVVIRAQLTPCPKAIESTANLGSELPVGYAGLLMGGDNQILIVAFVP